MKSHLLIKILLIIITLEVSSNEPTLVVIGETENPAGLNILKKAYEENGISLKYKVIPGVRGIRHVNDGKSDGLITKPQTIEKDHHNLIRLSPSILTIYNALFTINKRNIKNINNIQAISILRNDYSSEKYVLTLRKKIPNLKVYRVNQHHQVFEMVKLSRVEAGILPRVAVNYFSKQRKAKTHLIFPSIEKVQLFHYLHRKNERIVPQIEKTLRKMSLNGEIEKLNKSFFGEAFEKLNKSIK